ncbi:MAG: protein translocase subunit SecDF [Dysgonamonadaceae bacterium]|jgi:SecD/SecF fusion protein|nr:protein translocase subunit SecDF [Dysgonamonadaceae bacterium]
MQKGFIKFLAIALTLVSLFYLSFTVVTNRYYQQAKEYSGGIPVLENQYLDSLAKEKVWLGYSLEKCRAMEINLGLDLKGGMNVIMEIAAADVLKALADNNLDPIFNQALAKATDAQNKGQGDFISAFYAAYRELDPNAKLSAIFGTYELRDKIRSQSTNDEVISVLRNELTSAYDNSFNVLRNRIDKFGVVAPNIQRMPNREGQISIELPGVKDPDRVRDLLQGTANLEFWETYFESEIHQTLITANHIIRDSIQFAHQNATVTATTDTAITEAPAEAAQIDPVSGELIASTPTVEEEERNAIDEQAIENSQWPLFSLMGLNPSQPYQACVVASTRKSNMPKINTYLNNTKVKALLDANRISLKWTVKPRTEDSDVYELVALKVNYIDGKPKPVLSGDVIQDASDHFSQYSRYAEVSMTMKSEAAKIWARLTKDNIGRSVAIVLDDAVYSFPTVQTEISGGTSSITGNFTTEQAKDLANVLKSGRMSARAQIVQEEIVGPSLGQQAINQGFISFIIALIVIVLYLVVMYGWLPGLVASGALLLNLFFSLGVMASFHVVLTLSGIAGIVLALAMAVDANVIIYERIKEEIRGGKVLKKAVEEGYGKAFSAIFDANLTSILTGFILLIFGTGPIRGFAFTLIIGLFVSFFTAVFLTRITYEYLLDKGKGKDIRFTTFVSKNFLVDTQFNFLKNVKTLFVITGVAVVICAGAFLLRGLNQGIDYTGGRNYIIKFEQPINTVQAQTLLDPQFENHTPSVITIGKSNQVRVSTNYMIESNDLAVDSMIQLKLYEGLKTLLPEEITYDRFMQGDYIQSQTKVGPSIADDLKQKAIWAISLAVLAIGLYILLRFRDISYSLGSIIALTFDALFVIGAYCLLWGNVPFSLEVDQTFIGAILTVVGYSINDKVVIFDRVREYSYLYPKKDKFDIFNGALNSTLDRTFNTSFSTLLVLLIIFFLGGESIRSFSFAMIIGVIIGTISSLFIASPIAYTIQKNKANKALKK